MPCQFLSCDWGTSSFRLRLVDVENVAAEIREPSGVRAIFETGAGPPGFAAHLGRKLEEIAAGHSLQPNVPLVISGMASSTIGWKELPYARAPLALDGSGLRVERLRWEPPAWLGETYLVSGVATEREMMRGEECQIIGLMKKTALAGCAQQSILVLPGTHSKHVSIESHCVADFRTYMTGELFELLTRHSVLRATIDTSGSALQFRDAFEEGVRSVDEEGLAVSLFQGRTRGVLGGRDKTSNAAFLSGVLIGAEMSALRNDSRPVVIAAGPELRDLYSIAAKREVIAVEVEDALIAAHRLIIQNFG